MSKRQLHLVLVALFVLLQLTVTAQLVPEKLPVLLINEVHNEDYLNDDVFIELVVVKAGEVAHDHNNSYAKIIIDDTNEGPGLEPGFLAIKPEVFMFSKPGDIIVLHGSNTNTSSAPETVTLLDLNSKHVEKYENVPRNGNPSYGNGEPVELPNQKIKDYITFTGAGDVIQAKVGKRVNNKLEQTGSKNLSLATSDQTSYAQLPPSIGTPNNAANAEMIAKLKSSGPQTVKCYLFGPDLDDVHIVADGLPQFETIISSRPDPEFFDTNTFQLFDLGCGDHIITVTDMNSIVMTCSVYVPGENQYNIDLCKGNEIDVVSIIDCDNIQSDCIIMQVGESNPEKYGNLESILPFPLDQDEVITISFGDSDGNVTEEITITVRVVDEGDTCDDGNACTEDDRYDANCKCKGSQIEVPEIEEERETPCSNESSILNVVNKAYAKYTWTIKDNENSQLGRIVGQNSSLNVEKPGLYTVEVESYDGCILSSSYFVTIFSGGPIEGAIKASKERLCGNGDESVLEVIADYDEIEWSSGENSDEIIVNEPGIYKAEVTKGSCSATYFIEIKSTLGAVRIEPNNLIICPGEDGVLSLENLPLDFQGTFLWHPVPFSASSVTITEPNVYTVTITDSNSNCSLSLETTVRSSSDFDFYRDLLLSQEFEEFPLAGPPTLKDDDVSKRSSGACNVTGTDVNLMFADPPFSGGGIDIDAHAFLCQYHGEEESCSEGLFFSDLCPDATGTIEMLLAGTSDVEGIILENSEGDFFCYARSKNRTCRNYFDSDASVKFIELLNGILCAQKANQTSHTPTIDLVHTIESRISEDLGYENTIVYDNFFKGGYPLFDGVEYEVGTMSGGLITSIGSQEGGIHVSNYKPKALNLESIAFHEEVNEWCGTTGLYAQVTIEYMSCGLLTFTVLKNYGENLRKIFFETESVLANTVFNQTSLSEGIVNQVPLCYLNCDNLCGIYNSLLVSEDYKLGTILWLTSPEVIALMNPESSPSPECIISCFDGKNPNYQDKKITQPWLDLVDSYIWTYGSESNKYPSRLCPDDVDLLRNLSLQFFSMDKTNLPPEDDSEDSGIALIENTGPDFLGRTDFDVTYELDRLDVLRKPANPSGYLYAKNVPFDYYSTLYPVNLGKNYNFLCDAVEGNCARDLNDFHIIGNNPNDPDDPNNEQGQEQGAVVYLPGIYIGFSIEHHNHGQRTSNFFNSLDAIGLITPWAALNASAKAFRSRNWLRAFGIAVLPAADVVSSATSLFLNNTDYCADATAQLILEGATSEDLLAFDNATKDFCDKLRIVSFVTSTIALGNAGVSNQSNQMDDLIDAFREIDDANLATRIFSDTKYPDPNVEEYTELETMRRLATATRSLLPERIIQAFKMANRDDIADILLVNSNYLKGWTDAVPNAENIMNLIPQISRAEVDASTAKQFFDDVFASLSAKPPIPNSIGVKFGDLTGVNFNVWAETSKLKNYRKHLDFLETRKILDENDFAKHMDGEIEIVIKGPPPSSGGPAPVLWRGKYAANTFWDDFNGDLSTNPTILQLIKTNGTPTTNFTGFHDYANFTNLVSQGMAEIGQNPVQNIFNGMVYQQFKPRVRYPNWQDVKSKNFGDPNIADLSKAEIKNKSNISTFWPAEFSKSDMKEYASAAVYQGKLNSGGVLPEGIIYTNVTSPNSSIDNVGVIKRSGDIKSSFPNNP